MKLHKVTLYITSYSMIQLKPLNCIRDIIILTYFMSVCVNSCVHYIFFYLFVVVVMYMYKWVQRVNEHLFEKSFTDKTTKTLNTHEKLWLANRASHNMALAGPTAFWLASGHRATGKPDPCIQYHTISTKLYEVISLFFFTFFNSYCAGTVTVECHSIVMMVQSDHVWCMRVEVSVFKPVCSSQYFRYS